MLTRFLKKWFHVCGALVSTLCLLTEKAMHAVPSCEAVRHQAPPSDPLNLSSTAPLISC